jgi:hypothetical protein
MTITQQRIEETIKTWYVAKIGTNMSDTAIVIGMAALINEATGSSVHITNEGSWFKVTSTNVMMDYSVETETLLDRVLELPTIEEMIELTNNPHFADEKPRLRKTVGNFDGLLAVQFSKGKRLLSVSDLLAQSKKGDFSPIQAGLTKAQEVVEVLKEVVLHVTKNPVNWVESLLADYTLSADSAGRLQPGALPTVKPRRDSKNLSVPITLDPAWSYATRRLFSDGLITDKNNLTFGGSSYATLLAFIGAAKWLRAHRITGNLVNFYMPVPINLTYSAHTTLPCLSRVDFNPKRAVVIEWLNFYLLDSRLQPEELLLDGLAYQTMQTQGLTQSISIDRGYLSMNWLRQIENRCGQSIIKYWILIARSDGKKALLPLDTLDHLVDFLDKQNVSSWQTHLENYCRLVAHNRYRRKHQGAKAKQLEQEIRPYKFEEVKEIMDLMEAVGNIPLRKIMERKEGTPRIGHALELLGQVKPAALLEVLEALDSVRTRDQLIRILSRAVQECRLARAKSKFVIEPSYEDLDYLLEDLDKYGAHTLAGILMLLATFRYRKQTDDTGTDNSSNQEDITTQEDSLLGEESENENDEEVYDLGD